MKKEKWPKIPDEAVNLCQEELPEDLERYIRREVLPRDRTLIYKKGNVRGLCYACGERVKAFWPHRFRQGELTRCPNCGEVVCCYLETSDRFKVDYVENIVSLQKGTDGETVFLRQWHLLRDSTARWEEINPFLEEVARYAIRGDKTAKWQRENKENWYMKTYRYQLEGWQRMGKPGTIYDGQYHFHLPQDWEEALEGTSLRYCQLEEYVAYGDGERLCGRNVIRFLMEWARWTAVEKLWKAGYRQLVQQKVMGLDKNHLKTVKWNAGSIREALGMRPGLYRLCEPGKWRLETKGRIAKATELAAGGIIREGEIRTVVELPCPIEFVQTALEHATARKVARYLEEKDAQTWRDYLQECVTLGLDLEDEVVLFPKDLDMAHARTAAQVKYKASEEEQKALREQAGKLEKLSWQRDGLLIRPAGSGEELIIEGAYMHHCVGGYVGRMAKGETAILLIREESDPDRPFYTLEWKDGRVVQCRTRNNKSYREDARVSAFVDAWAERAAGKQSKKRTEAA